MKSVFAPVAAALVLATGALAQLTVNTPVPNPVVCQPVLITWSGGTPPYFLSIQPGNQPTAPPLIDFGQQTGTTLTWTANITAGTALGFTIKDSTGAINNSGVFTIQPGSDTSCLNGGSASSTPTGASTTGTTGTSTTPGTPATSPTTPANTPTPPGTTLTTPAGTTGAPTTNKPATTSATNTTSAANTASTTGAAMKTNAGFAGVFAAAAAVFAVAF